MDASVGGTAVTAGQRPPPAQRVIGPVLLRVTLVATLALASLEGYLQHLHPDASKVAPALFMLVWAVERLKSRRTIGVSHPVVWCCLGLLAVILISTAANLGDGTGALYLVRWLPFLVLVVALTDVLANDVSPWLGLHALLGGAALAGLGAVVSFAFLGAPRATGPLEDPNDLAHVLVAALPIALVAARRARLPAATLGWGLVAALLLVGAAATLSRGGGLAIAAVVLWAALRRVVQARLVGAVAVLAVLLAGPLLLVASDVLDKAVAQKEFVAGYNVDTRLQRWEAAARMLGDNLLLGVGPGGFRTHYVEYSAFAELSEPRPVAHQMYLEVGAELGLPGLTVFLGVILAGFVATETTVRRRRTSAYESDDPLLLAAFAVQGSLVAICVTSFFLSEQYYMPLWAGLAVAAAADIRSRREAS
jgi:putative inorganic carbon (hco3(-)) transporter